MVFCRGLQILLSMGAVFYIASILNSFNMVNSAQKKSLHPHTSMATISYFFTVYITVLLRLTTKIRA